MFYRVIEEYCELNKVRLGKLQPYERQIVIVKEMRVGVESYERKLSRPLCQNRRYENCIAT